MSSIIISSSDSVDSITVSSTSSSSSTISITSGAGGGGGGGGGGVFNCSVIGISSSSSSSILTPSKFNCLSYDLYSTAPQVTANTEDKPITKYRFLFLFKSAFGFFFGCMNQNLIC